MVDTSNKSQVNKSVFDGYQKTPNYMKFNDDIDIGDNNLI